MASSARQTREVDAAKAELARGRTDAEAAVDGAAERFMAHAHVPRNGDRALLVWWGGKASPVIGCWESGSWRHTGSNQTLPDMSVPLQTALHARDLFVACSQLLAFAKSVRPGGGILNGEAQIFKNAENILAKASPR